MPAEPPGTIDVSGEGLYRHRVGDRACHEGWCGAIAEPYPKACECGGLIHADFGDEDHDGNYWLYTKCDRCGEENIGPCRDCTCPKSPSP